MTENAPHATLKRRPIDIERQNQAIASGLDPVLARLIASRPGPQTASPMEIVSTSLKMLDHPTSLADMDKAVTRLIQALENNEIIGIETDHDCDGQTSHAVLVTGLISVLGCKPENIRSYIGHRLKEGYGLSESVANRILADLPKPTLVITADNGSSDEARIAVLKDSGIDVIVTDHHEIPSSGIPKSAYAVINPTRLDCNYNDKYIAGCMVAWLLLAGTRQRIMETEKTILPSLSECLDFVAVGTIADCVSMARSLNNRAVVNYGMKLISQGKRPCWRALRSILSFPLSSEDLGFKIGPLLNSDGRLACAFGSVSFLLAKSDEEATQWVSHLQEQNVERKAIQDRITRAAFAEALKQFNQGKKSLCIFLEAGHAGVHGISASRIKDAFGRPVIILCPKEDDPNLLTGSARSIDQFHLREALERINESDPALMERFGGHKGAAGLSLKREHFIEFSKAFEQLAQAALKPQDVGPVIWSDGDLPTSYLEISFFQSLYAHLEPFGREFEFPAFELTGKVLSLTPMGQTQTHLRLGIAVEDIWIDAVWFGARDSKESPWPIEKGDSGQFLLSPKIQTYRGDTQLRYQILHCVVENKLKS